MIKFPVNLMVIDIVQDVFIMIPNMFYLLFLTPRDLHLFIQERRSIRRFGEEMPPLSSIMKAIEDGMYAPSPVNSQP